MAPPRSGLASQQFPLQNAPKRKLTPLEQDVSDVFGMLPNEDRLSVLPRYKSGEGWIAPEMVYEAMKALQAPRTSMSAELSPEEAFNVALNTMGGSSVASAPKGSLRMGMASNAPKKAEPYLPGVHYADPLQPPTMKMSEALGASGSEGKWLRFTEADRSRVFGPNRGGIGFSGLQHYSDPHKQARTVWGYGNESTARKKINLGSPESTIWTTYAGSPTQHKSNTVVVKDAIKTLQDANRAGTVHPEQIKLINYRLQQAVGDKGKPLFPQGFDITDPKALSYATTFDRRAIISDALMGVGVKKPMKSVEFKEANPGVVYTNASDIENILARETEPTLKNANTFDVGPHLFDIENNIIHRPDLNEAFPYQVTGTDYGLRYEPTPFRIAAPTFTKDIPIDEAINAWKMSRGNPSEFISEEYLTNLQKKGYAKGGLIRMAEGGTPPKKVPVSQLFPIAGNLQDAPSIAPTEPKYPLMEKIGQAAKGVHEFASKPFGYENPPGEFISELLGIPAIGRTAENIAYEMPLTTGSGQTLQMSPDTAEAALTALPFAGKAAKLTAKGAKAAAPTAGRLAQEFAEKTQFGMPLQMNVVKPKGGNWLAGAPENLTKQFKNKVPDPVNQAGMLELEQIDPEMYARLVEQQAPNKALDKWIDQKLNKYIKNEMATPEDQIRLGIERRAAEAESLKELNNTRLAKMEADIAKAKAAGKDTTLSENDLAAAREKFDDEYAIASRGLYHGTAPEAGWNMESIWEPEALGYARKRAGFPEEGMATHPASKTWEMASDQEIRPVNLSEVVTPPDKRWGAVDTDLLKENPWIEKVVKENPKAIGYELDSIYPDVNLEFRHMIDEVKEAMNPNSVLPKNLRIAPKDLDKMTVDDVSALSGKISAWRDIQKTKADLQLANNPAVHMFKEYPAENNPKGVSWRQIKRPEGMPDDEAEKYVREATKYEGDIMRHCVGGAGHCEPLLRGDVEVYTLRDAKGEPHVTIEVEPAQKPYPASGEEFAMLDSATKAQYGQYVREWRQRNPEINNLTDEHVYQALKEAGVPPNPPRILEIKGKNNQKPKDEYIPFVQDFVKSGNFRTVGDSAYADMYQPNPKTLAVFKPDRPEIADLSFKERFDIFEKAKEAGELKSYLTRDDWENILLKYATGKGYAKGGAVDDLEARMNKMLAAHHYAKGGAVSGDSLEDRMNAMLAAHYAPQNMAEGGSPYNSNPDMADGGAFIQAGQFKIGGRIALIKH